MTTFRSTRERLIPVLGLVLLGALAAVPAFAGEVQLDDSSPEAVASAAAHDWLPWTTYGRSSNSSGIVRVAHGVQVQRSGGDLVSLSRRTGFDGDGEAIVVRFNLSMTDAASGTGTAQVIRVGAAFTTSNVDEPDAMTYARLGVNITDTATGFRLRDLVSGVDGPEFEGTQAITWVLNHSGEARSYAAPDGTTELVAADRMDVWAGRNRVFDDALVTTARAGLSDVKWVWRDGSGVTTVDRFEVRPLSDFPVGSKTAEPAMVAAASAPELAGAVSSLGAIQLYRPSPNPFANTTRYAYAISNASERVDIGVYDVAGRLIRNLAHGTQSPGQYEVEWDGRAEDGARVRQGVYFLRAAVGAQQRVARVVYLVR